jgi:hypothetical protein
MVVLFVVLKKRKSSIYSVCYSLLLFTFLQFFALQKIAKK